MIRYARLDERPAVLAVMRDCGTGWPLYDYTNMDGGCLVDEEDGELRGFVQFTLGIPDTQVRELGVRPRYQGTRVIGNLLTVLIGIAQWYGSQGIEGFQLDRAWDWANAVARQGAVLQHGTRVRFPLTNVTTRGARVLAAHVQRMGAAV